MNTWYESLTPPPLTPPNWVFGPAWTILYAMIAISVVLVLKNHKSVPGLWLYGLMAFHLLTNFAWTGIFFGLKSPGLALVDIVTLDVTLGVLIYHIYPVSRTAALLLIPYACWVLFATYLNAGFFWLNR